MIISRGGARASVGSPVPEVEGEVEDEEVLLTGIEEAHSADDVELDHVNPFMRGAPLIVVGAIAFGAVLAAKYCSRRA